MGSQMHKIKPVNVKQFLDQPDDDCHKSKHVAVMLYFNVSCVDGNIS